MPMTWNVFIKSPFGIEFSVPFVCNHQPGAIARAMALMTVHGMDVSVWRITRVVLA